MKKLLCIVLTVILTFSGCSLPDSHVENKLNRNFAAKATITQKSAAYTADFQINENGCSVAFILPEEISGLKINYNGTSFFYELDGLNFSAPPKADAEQFLPVVFSALSDSAGLYQTLETCISVQGSTQYGNYYINADKNTLVPLFFEAEDAELTIRFEPYEQNK